MSEQLPGYDDWLDNHGSPGIDEEASMDGVEMDIYDTMYPGPEDVPVQCSSNHPVGRQVPEYAGEGDGYATGWFTCEVCHERYHPDEYPNGDGDEPLYRDDQTPA